ncbi:MAG: hypothetical protein CM1200mP30_03210 [Pseudomonadota bacterium]|nr:MAG: hypothetical protein CM1200mP30_03210 [Pseudomonadota bacterium]
MKLTRVTENGGQYPNPALIDSQKPGVSRVDLSPQPEWGLDLGSGTITGDGSKSPTQSQRPS